MAYKSNQCGSDGENKMMGQYNGVVPQLDQQIQNIKSIEPGAASINSYRIGPKLSQAIRGYCDHVKLYIYIALVARGFM